MNDWNTMTPDERLAEVKRRDRNRTAGRSPTDDGPMTATQAITLRKVSGPVSGCGGFPAEAATVRGAERLTKSMAASLAELGRPNMSVAHPLLEPVTVTLPWSVLLPDNAKWVPVIRRNPDRAKLCLTIAYRSHKKRAVDEIRKQLWPNATEGVAEDLPARFPLSVRLQLLASLVEPDRRTRRDLSNYCKLVHDSMTGIVYDDDSQLDAVTWLRLPVDIDRPRLELTISPLPDA